MKEKLVKYWPWFAVAVVVFIALATTFGCNAYQY